MARKSRARGVPYEVGYRKPPVDTQFKKGQSGNTAGRPPKVKPAAPGDERAALDDILILVMDEAVPVQGVRGSNHVSGYEALLRSLRDQALAGDLRAAKLLLPQYQEAKTRREEAVRGALAPNQAATVLAAAAAMRAAKIRGGPSQLEEDALARAADLVIWGSAAESAANAEGEPASLAPLPSGACDDEGVGRCLPEGEELLPMSSNALRPSASETSDTASRGPRAECEVPAASQEAAPVRATRPARQIRQRNGPLIADRRPIEAQGWCRMAPPDAGS